jgi:predicted acyltransferase
VSSTPVAELPAIQPDRRAASVAGRILSLDVFRGGTIAAMILVNNPGTWSAIYPPFEHAEWHGWTFTDLVFPFFLWIVGVSITLSTAKRVERGDDRGRLFLHIVRRSVLIYAVGALLTLVPYFRFATMRIPGVLPRIAVCYLIGATIFLFTGLRGRVLWIAGLLTVYWVMVMQYPLQPPRETLEAHIDTMLLSGHMWSQSAKEGYDPEGLVSTLPAIATVLFGILAGMLLQAKRSMEEKAAWLFFTGNLLLFAGLELSTWMPINKKLWTSSFSVFMAGMAFVVFACCYWAVDVKGWKRFSRPFAIYGMNAITVYALSGLLAKTLGLIKVMNAAGTWVSLQTWIFESWFAPLAAPKNASLLFAIANVLLLYAVAYFMYHRKWFVRL